MANSFGNIAVLRPRTGLLLGFSATLAVMCGLHVVLFPAEPEAFFAFALFITGSLLLWVKLPVHYPHPQFGACNTVTLLRAGLGASLLTPLLTGDTATAPIGDWAVVVISACALSLDGVDGWLARRSGLASAYGARFDMEVDAALALILALHAFADGMVGPIVLVLGLMRYAFVASSYSFSWLSAPLPDRFGRKLVCVVQIAALIALQLPLLHEALAQWIAFGAALALIWSFGRDTIWLWRHRP
ncbi:MAG: CDP-alcohol phosphatidyltransferase family protein [Paracoccaceae bacterium]